MKKYQIPTAEYEVFDDAEEAIAYIKGKELPWSLRQKDWLQGRGS